MNFYTNTILDNHPCFNKKASANYGRVHLPVAPNCNIQCNFCNRMYDCANENRPGVTGRVQSPDEAVEFVERLFKFRQDISVIGIAGPGDPMCDADKTLSTFEKCRSRFANTMLCLSTNGLALPEHVDDIVRLGVSHVTVMVNAVTPDIGSKVYAWVRYKNRNYYAKEGARILQECQDEGIRKLKEAGMIVKINTVAIPGVNMEHIPWIAKKAKDWQVDIMNCMAMIPVHDTPFANIQTPSREEIHHVRKSIGSTIRQMTHCGRCRADACGKLREK
ncbi:radical SAM protein [Campylobacter sp. RM9328]|uniref:radical SAM protein n=1 Tax=Campylobacter sp. RM9328 TaxID=1705720 RepID=UPI001474E7B8|nr:radical SAM protein [Campylobacter sp. RM9328]